MRLLKHVQIFGLDYVESNANGMLVWELVAWGVLARIVSDSMALLVVPQP